MFKGILVPTDGSDLSMVAARKAIDFAKSIQASVFAFHNVPMFAGAPGGSGVVSFTTTHDAEAAARPYLTTLEAYAKGAGVACQSLCVFHDSTYHAIIAAAQEHECDLIFMGSHGRGPVGNLLIGSVTQKVLSHSDIPVLVYRNHKIVSTPEITPYASGPYHV